MYARKEQHKSAVCHLIGASLSVSTKRSVSLSSRKDISLCRTLGGVANSETSLAA
ncbi:MAG: hypothetical protein LBI44_03760 [Oscillospiraceae bacterium]|nr:hypothetical protein [Oscillospiraceae bacterium]